MVSTGAPRPLAAALMLAAFAGCSDDSRLENPAPFPGAQAAAASAAAPAPSAPSTGEGSTGVKAASLLLNEILFQPPPGEPQWIELLNTGDEPVKVGRMVLLSHTGETHALPADGVIQPGGTLLVRFDGRKIPFLHAEAGSVALVLDEEILDEAFWSTSGGRSFNLGRGGRIPQFTAGATLGRPPGSTRRGRDAWTVFDPADVTPAAPNPWPVVPGLMPLSGAMLTTSAPTLAWYGVPAAVRYRVQVAKERSFALPVFDRTVEATGSGIMIEQVTTPELPPDRYLWRVQAIFGDESDRRAPFSRPATVWVGVHVDAGHASYGSGLLDVLFANAHAAQPPERETQVILPVPFIMQRKDTSLLSLEADETGDEPWDRPWAMRQQPSYCARAAVAMVTEFFGGKLSQDRLSYEAHATYVEGPFHDIDVGAGLNDSAIEAVLKFALGSAPRKEFTPSQVSAYRRQGQSDAEIGETFWKLHKVEIDAGFPILATSDTHAFVITGYGRNHLGRYFAVNDPNQGQYYWLILPADDIDEADLWPDGPAGNALSTSFFLPHTARGRSQELEVTTDSDGDLVMDFDEIHRFGTDPSSVDTDQDGIKDKQEIRAWVFDERNGYSPGHRRDTSDVDRDGQAMQLDPDSDGGGCLDSDEDGNGNGKYEQTIGEEYNFDGSDDRCATGRRVWTGAWEQRSFAQRSNGYVLAQAQINFTYVDEPDEWGLPHWVSRRIQWAFESDDVSYDVVAVEETAPDARGFEMRRYRQDYQTLCSGSGTLELGPAVLGGEYYLTPEQDAALQPDCITTRTPRDGTPPPPEIRKKGESLGGWQVPSMPPSDRLEDGQYAESWESGDMSGSLTVSVSGAVLPAASDTP